MSKEIMQQALDKFRDLKGLLKRLNRLKQRDEVIELIASLEAELANPANEFAPDWDQIKPYHDRIAELEAELAKIEPVVEPANSASNFVESKHLAHPEQKPVASIYITVHGEREFDDWRCDLPIGRTELYTAPPKREWQGLTDDELDVITYSSETCVDYELFDEGEYGTEVNIYSEDFARAIEAKLREKNT